MKRIFCILLLVSSHFLTSWAQWTVPDSTRFPQPGVGAQAPWISNDNLRLYYSGSANLYIMSRSSVDSAWLPHTILPHHINLMPTQRCPAESPSGDTLYFVGDPRSDCDENYGSWDVYYTIRTGPCDTCWGPVHNAGPNVNSSHREFSVGISRDGIILLVASNRLGTIDADLYWHNKNPDGTWGIANHFPPEINDVNEGEEHPCLSPDNNTLYFCHRSVMLGDIWVTHRVNGIWQQAGPLPSPPNNWPMLSRDEDPCIALDGRTLWMRKSRTDNYDYQIVVTIDTSISAVDPRPTIHTPRMPKLAVSSARTDQLLISVTGVQLQQQETVELHDLLGRLIDRYTVTFSTDGKSSFGSISPNSLPSGTYFISLHLPTGTLSAKYIMAE